MTDTEKDKRIVACVNYCQGLPIDGLINATPYTHLTERIAELEDIHGQSQAHIKELENDISEHQVDMDSANQGWARADKRITELEGEKEKLEDQLDSWKHSQRLGRDVTGDAY